MNLSVVVEENVKMYMKNKGNIITISSFIVQGCCVVAEETDVSYKVPKDKTKYVIVEQDDLTIYIDKILRFKDDRVILSVSGFGPFKYIYAGELKRI
ncbi:CC/Se motif family (seleno)protein [Ureibacillus acetophenoni]|uniref:Uncharacterized protein n=1 Tax=Ureibacillus acetophenoni TaxID=614649 RepID=A0A285TYF4_9BACL|nr:CC/Se motif family (seleno)protein [Ureibacillus acetophenoni]SOC34685.1 hypothetical protein SAMN05877842_10121 [Ureibacillus acetophenoni]